MLAEPILTRRLVSTRILAYRFCVLLQCTKTSGMRGVKVSVPRAKADAVKDLVFGIGIKELSTYTVDRITSDGDHEEKVTFEIETNTPVAKRLAEALLEAPFFDQKDCFVSTRQRRSIISTDGLADVTWPWVEPGIDILQELWQFSHLTISLVLRTFIAGGLIAYGVINQQQLFLISGILFLRSLPIVLSMAFGTWLRQWTLVRTAVVTFGVLIMLLITSGAAVGAASNGPVRFDEFVSLPVSILVSIGVGIASALASSDDAGRRELIGLAATAQIAIIPVWIGACLVLGVPPTSPDGEMKRRILNFALNLVLIVISSTSTYVLLGAISPSMGKLKS